MCLDDGLLHVLHVQLGGASRGLIIDNDVNVGKYASKDVSCILFSTYFLE